MSQTDNTEEHEYTVGELEEMDLSPIKDKLFMVAVSTGDRDKAKFIAETICGPFDFYEMCETVGGIWESELLHAKAFVPSRKFGEAPMVLNGNTIDYIQSRYMDIVADGLLDGGVMNSTEYTCIAGFIPPEVKEEEAEEEEV